MIWRSGSSIVLYRGISYKLPCVQSFTSKNHDIDESEYPNNDSCPSLRVKCLTEAAERPRNGSTGEEILDLSEFNMMLDEVGPRFKDWSGRKPLPVDADLLPAVVPGYKPPFRRLAYGVKLNLKNKEMTYLRRTARIMPPHFALGMRKGVLMFPCSLIEESVTLIFLTSKLLSASFRKEQTTARFSCSNGEALEEKRYCQDSHKTWCAKYKQ